MAFIDGSIMLFIDGSAPTAEYVFYYLHLDLL